MKTFLWVLNDTFKAEKQLKVLSAVYKNAGAIRSAQLNLDLLGKHLKSAPDLKQMVQAQEKTATDQLIQRCEEGLKTIKWIRRHVPQAFQDLEDKTVLKFYKRRLKGLSRFFKFPDTGAEGLHDARKKLKRLVYFYKLLPDHLEVKMGLDTAYLDVLEDKIGKWHDLVGTLELLRQKKTARSPVPATLQRKAQNLYRQVYSMAEGFAHKVRP